MGVKVYVLYDMLDAPTYYFLDEAQAKIKAGKGYECLAGTFPYFIQEVETDDE